MEKEFTLDELQQMVSTINRNLGKIALTFNHLKEELVELSPMESYLVKYPENFKKEESVAYANEFRECLKNEFFPKQKKREEELFDQLEKLPNHELESVEHIIENYLNSGSSSIAERAKVLISKSNIRNRLSKYLDDAVGNNPTMVMVANNNLKALRIDEEFWKAHRLAELADKFINYFQANLKVGHDKDMIGMHVLWPFGAAATDILEKLSVFQEKIIELCSLDQLDHRGLGSFLFMIEKRYRNLAPYWTIENRELLQTHLQHLADSHKRKGDSWVKDNLYTPLKVVQEVNKELKKKN